LPHLHATRKTSSSATVSRESPDVNDPSLAAPSLSSENCRPITISDKKNQDHLFAERRMVPVLPIEIAARMWDDSSKYGQRKGRHLG
jgi:hypothetical protein